MHAQEHSTVREGLIAGLLGAALVATWYFVFDTAAGRPFHTPNVLGKVFFRGDLEPGVRHIVPRRGGGLHRAPPGHVRRRRDGADAAGPLGVAESLASGWGSGWDSWSRSAF